MKIKYIERATGNILEEKVPGEKALNFLYGNPFGELLLHSLVKRKFLSFIYGKMMSSISSKSKILPFIKDLGINTSEFKKNIDDFQNFNEFFFRELKPEARPINLDENTIVSPADGKILAYNNIKKDDHFFIKGYKFFLKNFLLKDDLVEKYEDGTLIIIRLAPVDYHRFHFPVDGKISATTKIDGDYFSVSPIALKNSLKIFCENKREYSTLSSEKFGDILMVEVGATMVGGIKQTYIENSDIKKGDEKGYFFFGGSTCVLIFEKDKVIIDDDILENTKNMIETKVYMGEKIGVKK